MHPDFVAPCVDPVDLDPEWAENHRYEDCSVSGHCGISINFAGFYPCAVGGAIDRIFRLNQAIVSLADVSEAAMIKEYQTFCRLCGYYRPIRESSQTVLSPAWRAALKCYRAHERARSQEVRNSASAATTSPATAAASSNTTAAPAAAGSKSS